LAAEISDTIESRFSGLRSGSVVLVLAAMLLVVGAVAASAQNQAEDQPPASGGFWGRTNASSDTLDAFSGSLWGPVPARHDSVSANFTTRSRPAWETAVMVPYWIVGIPFRIVYLGIDQTVIGMDKLGLFGAAAEYPGLKIPGGAYLMPVISIGDVEGFTLGLDVTRPNFLGPGNMLFIQGSRSPARPMNCPAAPCSIWAEVGPSRPAAVPRRRI
jgi:hypothetical protein